jgi:hypothetical protein
VKIINPKDDPLFRAWMIRRMTYILRREIYRAKWKTPPTNFWSTWKVRWVAGQGLKVSSDHPAALLMDQGVRKQPMTWLLRRSSVKPSGVLKGLRSDQKIGMQRPAAEGGGTYFRTPPKLGQAPWQHPGLPPKMFLSKSMALFQAELREATAAHIRKQIAKALKSVRGSELKRGAARGGPPRRS